MYSQGEMKPQQRPPDARYVYVKMLEAQADADEGKLKKGDVLVVPEYKAAAWVYRVGIARPASKKEFEDFKYKEYRASGGRPTRRGRVPRYQTPEENEFSYADQETPEWKDAEVNDSHASNQPVTLSEQLSSVGSDNGEEPPDPDAPEDMSEDEESEDSEDESPPHQEGGSFDQAITRGPGAAPEDDSPIRGRGRRGHL